MPAPDAAGRSRPPSPSLRRAMLKAIAHAARFVVLHDTLPDQEVSEEVSIDGHMVTLRIRPRCTTAPEIPAPLADDDIARFRRTHLSPTAREVMRCLHGIAPGMGLTQDTIALRLHRDRNGHVRTELRNLLRDLEERGLIENGDVGCRLTEDGAALWTAHYRADEEAE